MEDLIATIKMGENVVHLAVGLDGRGGYTDLRDQVWVCEQRKANKSHG